MDRPWPCILQPHRCTLRSTFHQARFACRCTVAEADGPPPWHPVPPQLQQDRALWVAGSLNLQPQGAAGARVRRPPSTFRNPTETPIAPCIGGTLSIRATKNQTLSTAALPRSEE